MKTGKFCKHNENNRNEKCFGREYKWKTLSSYSPSLLCRLRVASVDFNSSQGEKNCEKNVRKDFFFRFS